MKTIITAPISALQIPTITVKHLDSATLTSVTGSTGAEDGSAGILSHNSATFSRQGVIQHQVTPVAGAAPSEKVGYW